MAELRQLIRKLASVRALNEIVGAMRNMAAIYVRRAEATLDAIRPYADVVESALHLTLERTAAQRVEPPEDAPAMVIVFASDQGLCGAYNERAVTAATEFGAALAGPVHYAAIGNRARDQFALRGVEPVLTARAPTSLEGIRACIPDMAAQFLEVYGECGAEHMFFAFNEYEAMGRFRETVRRVLPPSPEQLSAETRSRFTYEPILTAPPATVLPHLVEEYVFVQLYRAMLESHASENGARLASMTAASTNVEKRLAELNQQYQTVRQELITAELLEVVGGAEALRDDT